MIKHVLLFGYKLGICSDSKITDRIIQFKDWEPNEVANALFNIQFTEKSYPIFEFYLGTGYLSVIDINGNVLWFKMASMSFQKDN